MKWGWEHLLDFVYNAKRWVCFHDFDAEMKK